MKAFMVYPNCAIWNEERKCIEMQIIQNRFERSCEPHKETRLEIESAARDYIYWLADWYQIVSVERRFM